MIELRTRLNVRLKTKTMNMDWGFSKGTSLLNVMLDLLRFTSIDLAHAKIEINKVIDKELQRRIDNNNKAN